MKKILALILAVALSLSMASVAFAADWTAAAAAGSSEAAPIKPGDKIVLTAGDFGPAGSTISDITNGSNYFSKEYFSATIRWDKGSNYVKSAAFDGDGNFVIEFKGDAVKVPGIANVVLKELKVRSTKEIKIANVVKISRGTEFAANDLVTDSLFFGAVSNKKVPVGYSISSSEMGEYFKFDKNSSGDSYDTTSIDFDNLAYGEVRTFSGDSVYVNANNDVNSDLVKANPNAEINFVNLTGKFNSAMSLEIFADEGTILYEVKDGKLVKSAAKYDDGKSAFVLKTTEVGKYVISDIELVNAAAAPGEDNKNPNTGANDVVGVAVALAVVSLVAAGAVSLKK